jgi:uncharacterized membrane protein
MPERLFIGAMSELLYSFTHRPYVIAFLLAFIALSWIEQGRLRTACWLVTGYLVAFGAEWASLNHGVPFGFYIYHHDALQNDLMLAGVPFFSSLLFVFLSYVSFSFAQFFLSPLHRRGFDIQRITPRNVRNSAAALFLGAFLMTVIALVTDPATHLGAHWFLGDIYSFPDPGYHYDVTLANYAGWFIVGWVIMFINQRADTWLAQRELVKDRPVRLPHVTGKGLFAPLFWLGVVGLMLGVTAWLGWGYDLSGVPEGEREAWVATVRKLFLSSVFIITPIAVLAWAHVIRRQGGPDDAQVTAWLADYPNDKLAALMGRESAVATSTGAAKS